MKFETLVKLVSERLDEWPETDWERPVDVARYIGEHLIHCAVGNLVHLHAFAPKFPDEIQSQPFAGHWARIQATEGERVTNQKHEIVVLDDPARWVLARLDGRTSIEDLADELSDRVASGEFQWETSQPGDHGKEAVMAYLKQFRDGALLQPNATGGKSV